jgi:GNAT superfamily N-acetyltransferase
MRTGIGPRPQATDPVKGLRDGVRRCTEEDLPDLHAFYQRVFGPDCRQLDPGRAAWLFWDNPCRPAEGPDLWIRRQEGRIAGIEGAIPFDLEVGGEECRASWGVDLRVEPESRGRGLGPELSDAFRASCRIACVLGLSGGGYRHAMRRGYVDLGTMPEYVSLMDSSLLRHGTLPWPLRMGARPMVGAVTGLTAKARRRRSAPVELVPIEAFDERADAIWREASPSYEVVGRRDAARLKWRFDLAPHRLSYRRFYLCRDGQSVAYVVLRPAEVRARQVLRIVDYLAAPPDIPALFAATAGYVRECGAAALFCSTLNPHAGPGLRSLGFFRIPRRYEVIRFVSYADPNDPLRDAVSRRESWFITAADSDFD